MRQAPLHLTPPSGLPIGSRTLASPPAGPLGALGLLVGHGAQQDGLHVAACGQLIKPFHRQQRPLAAALARSDDLNGHVLVAVGQLPDLLRQHIQGDGALVVGVLMDNQLANWSSSAWRPERSETRICLTATAASSVRVGRA
jgi:hypothetical protein